MRPQSINCGNEASIASSMRPQSINCGNLQFNGPLDPPAEVASMRPQSINCGNP